MKRFISLILLVMVLGIYGCKSIHVGGNAQAGTVSGSGQVTVSLPKEQ